MIKAQVVVTLGLLARRRSEGSLWVGWVCSRS